MDRRCVYYKKSLLESGTLGTKGNVQVWISNMVLVSYVLHENTNTEKALSEQESGIYHVYISCLC